MNWTGFYVGGHLGYGQGPGTVTDATGASQKTSTKGFLGGLQTGYNYQTGKFVLGVEADISGTNIDGTTTARDATGDISTSTPQTRWTSLLTGRIGYAADRALIYAKGGLAFAGLRYTAADLTNGGVVSANLTRTGWTLGAGLEYALTPAWSVRAEYDYLNFASRNFSVVDPTGATGTLALRQQLHQAKFGVNYRFGAR